MPLTENQLIIPALIAMINNGGTITTTELIAEISNQFVLDSTDQQQLLNRNDVKYTQIVRNLKSHKTFVKKGFAEEIDNGFRILGPGIDFLEDCGFI